MTATHALAVELVEGSPRWPGASDRGGGPYRALRQCEEAGGSISSELTPAATDGGRGSLAGCSLRQRQRHRGGDGRRGAAGGDAHPGVAGSTAPTPSYARPFLRELRELASPASRTSPTVG